MLDAFAQRRAIGGGRSGATRALLELAARRGRAEAARDRRTRSTALLGGLDGRYVPAGPSGSPTRGRLDVLPTGRNFYSRRPEGAAVRAGLETGAEARRRAARRHSPRRALPETVGHRGVGHGRDAHRRATTWPRSSRCSASGPRWSRDAPVAGLEVDPAGGAGPAPDRRHAAHLRLLPRRLPAPGRAARRGGRAGRGPRRAADELRPQARAGRRRGAGGRLARRDRAHLRRGARAPTASASCSSWTSRTGATTPTSPRSTWPGAGYAYGRGLRRRRGARRDAPPVRAHRRRGQEPGQPRARHLRLRRLPRRSTAGWSPTSAHLTGARPAAWFGDSSDPARPPRGRWPRRRARVFRTRVREPALDRRDDAPRLQGRVRDGRHRRLPVRLRRHRRRRRGLDVRAGHRAYVGDPEVRKFFERSNPWALRAIAERLLEAAERGLWARRPRRRRRCAGVLASRASSRGRATARIRAASRRTLRAERCRDARASRRSRSARSSARTTAQGAAGCAGRSGDRRRAGARREGHGQDDRRARGSAPLRRRRRWSSCRSAPPRTACSARSTSSARWPTGEPRSSRACWRRAHGGVLYVDEVNLLADHLVDVLLDAAALGPRATSSATACPTAYDARFVLVGTMNPEEGDLRPQLLDRFGLSRRGRRLAATRRRAWRSCAAGWPSTRDPAAFAARFADGGTRAARRASPRARGWRQCACRDRIAAADRRHVRALGVDGHRADIVTARAATALAALDGADEVDADHVRRAARLALAHRRRRGPLQPPGLDDSELDDALGGRTTTPSRPRTATPRAAAATRRRGRGERARRRGRRGEPRAGADGRRARRRRRAERRRDGERPYRAGAPPASASTRPARRRAPLLALAGQGRGAAGRRRARRRASPSTAAPPTARSPTSRSPRRCAPRPPVARSPPATLRPPTCASTCAPAARATSSSSASTRPGRWARGGGWRRSRARVLGAAHRRLSAARPGGARDVPRRRGAARARADEQRRARRGGAQRRCRPAGARRSRKGSQQTELVIRTERAPRPDATSARVRRHRRPRDRPGRGAARRRHGSPRPPPASSCSTASRGRCASDLAARPRRGGATRNCSRWSAA